MAGQTGYCDAVACYKTTLLTNRDHERALSSVSGSTSHGTRIYHLSDQKSIEGLQSYGKPGNLSEAEYRSAKAPLGLH